MHKYRKAYGHFDELTKKILHPTRYEPARFKQINELAKQKDISINSLINLAVAELIKKELTTPKEGLAKNDH